MNLRATGKYSDREQVHAIVHGYTLWEAEKFQAKKYADVAYIRGYLNAMLFVTAYGEPDLVPPPLYLLFGKKHAEEFDTLEEFSKGLKKIRRTKQHHAGALKEATKATAKLNPKEAVILHHKCQLH